MGIIWKLNTMTAFLAPTNSRLKMHLNTHLKIWYRMTDKELKELISKSAQAHAEVLKYCDGELMRAVSITAVLRLHDGTVYSPGDACPVCGGEMVIEKIQMQERYMMRLCHRCGTTIKTPFTNIEVHTPF